ncbi:exodeoxyribonuclease V subunit gamma [Gordonia sp. TBRC 11910]|uniref:RecBCD enzyme subunit RecC n=1 Tax=Gordonia asplenii TaxID=2725283 RepID=A0A848KTY3_9ACTN|nr:exodeoxyribonuclease V subunit gamma [Gordonia asplenii]NMO00335.1 exodeoxyribonuclease V subunit gamma [Gordonia asplenii]
MFIVHRAERADTLADALAGELATPLADPMQTEIVAVPARGVERWLQQHLATTLGALAGEGDGIAANIDFSSPTRIVADIVERLSKDPAAAENWRADRLVWPVLATLDDHLHDPRLAVIAHHIGHDESRGARLRRGRRLSTARTIANLFDGYAWQRPGMLRDWAAGHDTDGAGSGTDLPDSLAWQPWFWRLVRERVGVAHLAEELDTITAHLREHPDVVDLPDRLAVFGPTRIPQMMRDVLHALALHRRVNLYLPHPSDALWQAVATDGASSGPTHRGANGVVALNNPLLASLSRDVAELQRCLGDTDTVYHPSRAPRADTLLAQVQAALRTDVSASVDGATPDTSLEIHSCHGPERQVEVLRDRLLRLFADDETLQPRDVLIMCPDVEVYAPLIRGAFGQTGLGHPAFALRVRLADRGLRQTNDVLDAVAALLELAAGRARIGELLDFAARESVRARFGFTDDDLDALANWSERANIRWGIDNTQRNRFGLSGFPQGTAQTGLDRIVLGVVADESEDEWLSTALPLSGVDSTDTDLVGRFAEFVERLGELMATLSGPRSASEWAEVLVASIDLLTDTDYESEWQRAQAVGLLGDALALPAGIDPPDLELNDIRDLMSSLLAARPTRSNFRTGELTVCSMVPMRSVPHRAIILLGMDDGAFPRSQGVDGDDILAVVPLIGERDVRNEDRQVFLDAITAARDHLLVFYSGADPVSGTVIPPAVVVSELIDAANAVLDVAPGVGSPVVQRHSLHAFESRNFVGSAGSTPCSFDAALLPGARALAALTAGGVKGEPRVLLADARLPPNESADIELDDLVRFLANPLEGFVRQRLGGQIPETVDAHPDQLQVKLDPLDAWGIGDRFLAALLAGDDVGVAQQAELRRGTLPPFSFGAQEMRPIVERAQAVYYAAQGLRSGAADAIDVRVELPDGRRIYGTVGDIYPSGVGAKRLCTVTYSSLSSKHRLQTWIKLLALTANTSPAPAVAEAVVIGRGKRGQPTASSTFRPPADALDILTMLVAFRDAALQRPISLPLSAANACAQEFDRSGNHTSAMRRASYAFRNAFSDFDDDYLGLVFDDRPSAAVDFERIVDAVPADLDSPTPWLPGNSTAPMFVRISSAIFGPLLQNEEAR